MWMSTARVILFGMIPTTIPSTAPTIDLPVIHDDTLLIPTDTPTISSIVPTIPPIAPTILHTSPFICTDSSDSDTSERPPSQDPYEVTVAQWKSRVATRSSPPSLPIRQILPALPGLPCRLAILVLPKNPIHADIDSCIAFVNDITARGIDVRVEMEAAAEEESESSARGTIKIGVDRVTHLVVSDDIHESVREDFLSWIVTTSQQSAAMFERIGTLERDNMRLRGMLGFERHRVDRLQRSMSYAQRDLYVTSVNFE
nr:hypothetical protein [Tanacetum cinerariifolium]